MAVWGVFAGTRRQAAAAGSRKRSLVSGGAGVALILAAAIAAGSPARASDETTVQIGLPLFPLLTERSQELARITIETGLYRLALERRDGVWVAIDRGDYPVLSRPIDTILAAVAALPASELRSSDPATHAQYAVVAPGPENESIRITAETAGGEILADAIIGNAGLTTGPPPRGGTHVRRADEDHVWVAEGFVTVPRHLALWFAPVANVRGPDIVRISILSGERMLVAAVKADPAAGDYVIADLDPELGNLAQGVVNNQAIRAIAQAVVTIAPTDVAARDAIAVPEDARTVRYEMEDGLTLDVTLVDVAGVVWVLVDASAEAGAAGAAGAAAIRAVAEHWAFILPPQNIATLTQDLANIYAIQRPAGDEAIPY